MAHDRARPGRDRVGLASGDGCALARHASAEHAYLEGEGDRSLATWREVHERFVTEHAAHTHGFSRDMPVVLQRIRRPPQPYLRRLGHRLTTHAAGLSPPPVSVAITPSSLGATA